MKHYVYVHFTKDELRPFYIGKGIGARLNRKNSRNRWWHFVVEKHGFVSDVLKEFDTHEEALLYEVEMIAFFKSEGMQLVNLTNGGEGSVGVKASEETKRKIGYHSKMFPRGQSKPSCRIVATNVDNGSTVSMIGKTDILSKGFQPRCVYACCNGKQSIHLNHTFHREQI